MKKVYVRFIRTDNSYISKVGEGHTSFYFTKIIISVKLKKV